MKSQWHLGKKPSDEFLKCPLPFYITFENPYSKHTQNPFMGDSGVFLKGSHFGRR